MMSPASAVSAISRSCAKNRIGECTAIGLPEPEGVSFMPRLKVPETIRMNAIRSRCCGSMLAWTLNTKPVTSSRSGLIGPSLGSAAGAAAGRSGRSRRSARRRRSSSAPSRSRPASGRRGDRPRRRTRDSRRAPARFPRRCRRAARAPAIALAEKLLARPFGRLIAPVAKSSTPSNSAAHARPASSCGRHVERQQVGDFVEHLEPRAAFAVDLVDSYT